MTNEAFNLEIQSKGELNKWQGNAIYERKDTLICKEKYKNFHESLVEAEEQCLRSMRFQGKPSWYPGIRYYFGDCKALICRHREDMIPPTLDLIMLGKKRPEVPPFVS